MGISFESFLFTFVPIITILGFTLVLVLVIIRVVQGAKQWNRNNHAPVLTVNSKIVAKRIAVSQRAYHHGHADSIAMNHTGGGRTVYYATFEVESGDRMEFRVPDNEYGMLADEDKGMLTFQGTRYIGFQRYR